MLNERVEELLVATPERVLLALPTAGVGARAAAYLIDALVLFAAATVLLFSLSLVGSDGLLFVFDLAVWGRILVGLGVFFGLWGYWVASEVLSGGKSLGKHVMGLRVVRADGTPVTALESAVRNLVRAVDFLPFGYAVGLTTMLIDPRQRRLGDLAAGTVIVRDRVVDLKKYEVGARGDDASVNEWLVQLLARSETLERDAFQRLALVALARHAPHLSADKARAIAADPSALKAYFSSSGGAP